MRRACVILAALGLAACSTARAKPPAIAPAVRAAQQLGDAEALVRAGCYDCLQAAARLYDGLRTVPAVVDAAALGAARAAMLLGLRERELGTGDSGAFAHAAELAASVPSVQQAVGRLLEIADTLPSRAGGDGRQVSDDRELARMQKAYRNRAAWTEQLRPLANGDAVSAYVWAAFSCAYPTPSSTPGARAVLRSNASAVDEAFADIPAWRDTPLLAFKAGTCGTFDAAALAKLLAREPRFLEVNYFLGLRALIGGHLDEADTLLERAYAWHPRWPSVTNALGGVAMTAEDFDRSVQFFERTLDVAPRDPDGLLGKVRALTYLGHHEQALSAVDALLALEHWYIGDARYWRALNEAQLGRNGEAWIDVEAAAKLLINAEVPKLAGIISYRLHHLAIAQAKFEESSNRNATDCETRFYLGIVLSDERLWARSAAVLVSTAACLDAARTQLAGEIETIRASDDPPERKARQIAKREQQIADALRMRATSFFNTAIAYYNLEQKPAAREYAEKVLDDEQFGERARDLLSMIGK